MEELLNLKHAYTCLSEKETKQRKTIKRLKESLSASKLEQKKLEVLLDRVLPQLKELKQDLEESTKLCSNLQFDSVNKSIEITDLQIDLLHYKNLAHEKI